ncbi:MAG TPA: PHB depolymerase family esterase [Caulobacteraceae bacterium]|nr:PHB depolymerase family esterase [Caulobacteraceae bacterium]
MKAFTSTIGVAPWALRRRGQATVMWGAALAAAMLLAAASTQSAYAADAPILRKGSVSIGGGMAGGERSYSYYVSPGANRFGYNLVVYALHDNGQSAEEFARSSGWLKVADEHNLVVVFPEGPNKTWSPYSTDNSIYLKAVYDNASNHMTVDRPTGAAPPLPAPDAGAPRVVAQGDEPAAARRPAGPIRIGTWQPWQYFTGAGAGAIAAQEFAIDYPGVVTALATLDGVAYDAAYRKGEETVQGFLENQRGGHMAKPQYQPAKKDVPVPTWLFTSGPPNAAESRLANYWKHSDAVTPAAATRVVGGFQTVVYTNAAHPEQQVRTTAAPEGTKYDAGMAEAIWSQFFAHIARWTDSPNGTLGPMMTEPEVNQAFTIKTLASGDRTYKYYVKTPSSYRKGQSVPLVIALHGGNYPAWMYLSQIRMHEVGEKEGFVTVYLNGQNNFWDFTKADGADAQTIEKLIGQVATDYGIDRSRVYLQGFSFGSGMTFMMGMAHPELFAAVSPNSGIGDTPVDVDAWVRNLKAKSDIRIPEMMIYGAMDPGGSTDGKIPATGILRTAIDRMKTYNHITTPDRTAKFVSPNTAPYDILVPGAKLTVSGVDAHFPAGRFLRYDYVSADPKPLPLFSFVLVNDMPHGSDLRQAQMAWDFFKNWRRNPDGSVVYVGS